MDIRPLFKEKTTRISKWLIDKLCVLKPSRKEFDILIMKAT